MRIDIFHDTVCPWCRIGKQNLKSALARWTGDVVTVSYHTFFLNNDIPSEGYDFLSYMQTKGGGRVSPEQWFDAPREAGRRAGLVFNFERIQRAPNTLLSHQLIALAADEKREAVIDSLYAAYFEQGCDIGDMDVLVEIAQTHGLGENVRQQLMSTALRDQVLADAARAHELGITGVPFIVINDRFAFSGAQSTETMLRILQQVSERQKQEVSEP